MRKEELFKRVIEEFEASMPDVGPELVYKNPFELLVAVILSAQCTDKRVNMLTPLLFSHFPDATALSKASIDEIYQDIRSISYPNNKAKHLKAMASRLVEEYKGVIPSSPRELETLQGVGRKTAHVIASVIFDQPTLAVDTHVFRVSDRLGLSVNAKTPLQTENQLMKYLPLEKVNKMHHWLILHGRYTCTARHPKCMQCTLSSLCRFYSKCKK